MRVAGNYSKQRRLARAIAPHQTNPFASIDLEADLGQERDMAVGVGDVIEAK